MFRRQRLGTTSSTQTIVLAPNVVVFFFDQYANTLLGSCNGLRSYQPTSCGCQGSVFLEWTIGEVRMEKEEDRHIPIDHQLHQEDILILCHLSSVVRWSLTTSSERSGVSATRTESLYGNSTPNLHTNKIKLKKKQFSVALIVVTLDFLLRPMALPKLWHV